VATLKRFYGEIRKADGTLYAKKSMITLMIAFKNTSSKVGKRTL
jgi:hypothetical protein